MYSELNGKWSWILCKSRPLHILENFAVKGGRSRGRRQRLKGGVWLLEDRYWKIVLDDWWRKVPEWSRRNRICSTERDQYLKRGGTILWPKGVNENKSLFFSFLPINLRVLRTIFSFYSIFLPSSNGVKIIFSTNGAATTRYTHAKKKKKKTGQQTLHPSQRLTQSGSHP